MPACSTPFCFFLPARRAWGFRRKAAEGSSLDPAAVGIRDVVGNPVSALFSNPDLANRTQSLTLAELAFGSYTLSVGGDLSTGGVYEHVSVGKDRFMQDVELRNTLLSCSTPLFVDARVRLGLPESHLDPGIRPVVPFNRMAGTAVTVRLEVAPNEASADLTPLVWAYESQYESSGSIIVIQVPAERHGDGIFGEGAATMARRGGFVGALVEGAVRDSLELREMQFPAFSRTIAPGYIVGKASAVAVEEPVLVGGRTIHAGDVIVADNDGVVILRPEELDEVVARALAIKEWEHRMHSLMTEGKSAKEAEELAGLMP